MKHVHGPGSHSLVVLHSQMKAMNQTTCLYFYLQHYYFLRAFLIYLACEAAAVSVNVILAQPVP